jgi:hypothetical protein
MFNPFKQITDENYAKQALQDARLMLLKAHAAREYADSIVQQKTAEISRLETYLGVNYVKVDSI